MTSWDLLARGITYCWQVALHSAILGVVMLAWTRVQRLSPGRTRRRLLEIVLALPLGTAALASMVREMAPAAAWLDSGRALALELVGPVELSHAMVLAGLAAAVVTGWQEVLPIFERSHAPAHPGPRTIVDRARSLPGWETVTVEVVESDELFAWVRGTPWRPRLALSGGLVSAVDGTTLDAVLRHERAHLRPARWLVVHALYAMRIVQCFNPVALWVFREYSIEVEIVCDAEAVQGDPRPLARALFAVYEQDAEGDSSHRRVLRRRIDVLLGRIPAAIDREQLPGSSLAVATATLGMLLSWVI